MALLFVSLVEKIRIIILFNLAPGRRRKATSSFSDGGKQCFAAADNALTPGKMRSA